MGRPQISFNISMIFKMCSIEFWPPPNHFNGVCKIKSIFILIPRYIFYLFQCVDICTDNAKIEGKILACVHAQSLSCVQLFATPWTVAHQAPLSMQFSRQEYWSRLSFLLLGISPTQESNQGLLHCRRILYQLSYQGIWLLKVIVESFLSST